MLREQRVKAIIEALSEQDTVPLGELVSLCSASEMTIRRDLAELERQGRIRRVRGGAALIIAETDPGYWHRAAHRSDTKRMLGKKAASMVEDGQTLFLDAGTTITELARALAVRVMTESIEVRVVTHAVNISTELSAVPSISVHQLGGEIDPGTLSATGHDLAGQISDMNFDLFFLGATGISLHHGCTNSAPKGVEVKRAAFAQARRTWLVADSTKWKNVSTYKILDVDALHGWITDTPSDDEEVQDIGARGIELELVTN